MVCGLDGPSAGPIQMRASLPAERSRAAMFYLNDEFVDGPKAGPIQGYQLHVKSFYCTYVQQNNLCFCFCLFALLSASADTDIELLLDASKAEDTHAALHRAEAARATIFMIY